MAEEKLRQRWRENIEALTMAVVIALLFKAFILEISKIPSGSMQPTLMGSPETGIFDRILVDKLSYHYRDPERFEIVVFRHPLERSRVMVKRLVGMPGEDLRIENGDLWVRPAGGEWHVLRRPPSVQRSSWKRLDREAPQRSSWNVISGGRDWRLSGRRIVAHGDGHVRFRAELGEVRDGYSDGYPDSIRNEVSAAHSQPARHAVGDLRLEGEIQAEAGCELLSIELTEGGRTYGFRIPGPGAPADAVPTIDVRDPDTGETSTRGESWRLPTDDTVAFAVENLDDRLALELDGETVLEVEIAASERQEAFVTVEVRGTGAEILDLQVFRDTYYYWPDRPGKPWTVTIPAGEYVMLGDNTQDSADSRDWEAVTYSWTEDGVARTERGNYRPGRDAQNPVRTADGTLRGFRDLWGERHWFPLVDEAQTFPGPAPTVPRELIQGRALAVFWPIKPARRLWRLGWLH